MAKICEQYIAGFSRARQPNIMHVEGFSVRIIALPLMPIRRHNILVAVEAKHNVELKPLRFVVSEQVYFVLASRPKSASEKADIRKHFS